jgi:hypothetical protein
MGTVLFKKKGLQLQAFHYYQNKQFIVSVLCNDLTFCCYR